MENLANYGLCVIIYCWAFLDRDLDVDLSPSMERVKVTIYPKSGLLVKDSSPIIIWMFILLC